MQYQNNTELAKGKIFKYKYFKHFEEYDIDYDLNRVRVKVLDSQGVPYWIPVRIYMGADLAISEDETSNNDYFVLTVIGVDKNKNVYVLDYLKERLTFNAQLNAILDYGKNKFPMKSWQIRELPPHKRNGNRIRKRKPLLRKCLRMKNVRQKRKREPLRMQEKSMSSQSKVCDLM